METWKPIADAPLDKFILAGGYLQDGGSVGWVTFVIKKIRAYPKNDKAFYHVGWSFYEYGKPTHYMDIPEPPEREGVI